MWFRCEQIETYRRDVSHANVDMARVIAQNTPGISCAEFSQTKHWPADHFTHASLFSVVQVDASHCRRRQAQPYSTL